MTLFKVVRIPRPIRILRRTASVLTSEPSPLRRQGVGPALLDVPAVAAQVLDEMADSSFLLLC